jgi:hypothetical protein
VVISVVIVEPYPETPITGVERFAERQSVVTLLYDDHTQLTHVPSRRCSAIFVHVCGIGTTGAICRHHRQSLGNFSMLRNLITDPDRNARRRLHANSDSRLLALQRCVAAEVKGAFPPDLHCYA